MRGPADQVDHVVVVMLENRAFDHLLGFLDHSDPAFDGISAGAGSNPLDPARPELGTAPAVRRRRVRLRVDPDHAHEAVMSQLGAVGEDEPLMSGFVRSYELKATGEGPGPRKARRARRTSTTVAVCAGLAAAVLLVVGSRWLAVVALVVALGAAVVRARFVPKTDHFPGLGPRIMSCWDPTALPAIATLARSFAVCTRWFSSVPGETWPNRQFAHAATSAGTVDIELCLYHDRTIFELLEEHGQDWRIYYDGPPQVLCYPALWCGPDRLARWFTVDRLFEHIEAGTLPGYSFVEPNHGYVGRSYSQHPGNNRRLATDFRHGDGFVAAIYEALRSRPEVFDRTVMLITYDEHGGTWDHVPPPLAVAPDGETSTFGFDRLGARVPAIVVSPRIAAGTVDSTVRDHSSIPATLRQRFAPGAAPLTERDAAAASFLDVVTLTEPRTDLPDLSRHAWRPSPAHTPVDTMIGWLKGLRGLPDRAQKALGWLAGQLDESLAAAEQPVPRRAPSPPEPSPVPEAAPPRRAATRAMRSLAAASESARTG